MGYRKPVLTELYVEMHFEPGSLTLEQELGLVPLLKAKLTGPIEITGQVEPTASPTPMLELRPRIRCWSPDKRRLAQLAADLVVVNQVGDYLGWKAFRETFDLVCNVLGGVGIKTLSSMALHTTDRFRAPVTGFRVGRYINCDGQVVPMWFRDVQQPIDLVMGKGVFAENLSNRQIQLSCKRHADDMLFNVESVFHDKASHDQIANGIEALHAESNEVFERWITDELRTMMGGRA